MKRPCHSIQSTTPKSVQPPLILITAAPTQLFKDAPIQLAHPPISIASSQEEDIWAMPPVPNPIPQPNFIIDDKSDASVANIFAFGAFANKNSGIVYNNLTGLLPFMSLDGSICFFCPIPLQIKLHPGRSDQGVR